MVRAPGNKLALNRAKRTRSLKRQFLPRFPGPFCDDLSKLISCPFLPFSILHPPIRFRRPTTANC